MCLRIILIIPIVSGKGWGFLGIGSTPPHLFFFFWSFLVSLRTVMGMPFSWRAYDEAPGPEERPWCWERLRAGGEGDGRGWDGWMASLTGWIWVLTGSGSWWWTGKPGVLQSMGLQRVGHDWATELKIHRKLTCAVLVGLCLVLRLCCSFKGCALHPSLLFQYLLCQEC